MIGGGGRRHHYVTSAQAGAKKTGDWEQKLTNWERFLPNLRSARAGEEQRLAANAARRTGHQRGSIALLPGGAAANPSRTSAERKETKQK